MPLHQIIEPNLKTKIYVWKITESLSELISQVSLKEKTEKRLNGMKSELHQRGFLSVRMLLQEAGLTDFDLHYDDSGKPYLDNHKYISITHSHNFSAIIISDETVGIDIELQREKIQRIADKFVDKEFAYLNTENTQEYIKKLTVIWGAKEAIFKIRNEKGISFKDHIEVDSFQLSTFFTKANLYYETLTVSFDIFYTEIENFTLVYAFEK